MKRKGPSPWAVDSAAAASANATLGSNRFFMSECRWSPSGIAQKRSNQSCVQPSLFPAGTVAHNPLDCLVGDGRAAVDRAQDHQSPDVPTGRFECPSLHRGCRRKLPVGGLMRAARSAAVAPERAMRSARYSLASSSAKVFSNSLRTSSSSCGMASLGVRNQEVGEFGADTDQLAGPRHTPRATRVRPELGLVDIHAAQVSSRRSGWSGCSCSRSASVSHQFHRRSAKRRPA